MTTSSTKLRVRYQETDRMGIVYYSNYFIWFEVGRTELFKKIGIAYPRLERKGCFLVVAEAQCSYKAPATYEDDIEIVTRLAEMKNSTLKFEYEIRKGSAVITTGSTKHVFLDASGKIMKIPKLVAGAVRKEGVS